jgi:hypothetical protein
MFADREAVHMGIGIIREISHVDISEMVLAYGTT